jgi:DNA-binding response OmpR family regulator
MRRPRQSAAPPMPSGMQVDLPRHHVAVDGNVVDLTATEFGILSLLLRDPGVVVTRSDLLDAVWGPGYEGDDHLVDVHVANLRRKLGDHPAHPRFIETVRRFGYRLVANG